VNGEVPDILKLGTVAQALVRGVQADPTGSVVKTIVVAPHHLLLLTERTNLRLPDLKDKAEVQGFGQVWQPAVSARISTTEPHNPVSNLDQRLMTGKDPGRRERQDGLGNLNHNRRLHLAGDRLRGTAMIEVKDLQIWVR